MTRKDFSDLVESTYEECTEIIRAKGVDYTKSSEDALANFKETGKDIGIDPLQVWYIFAQKHWQAIANYVKTGGQSESEPIEGRIHDAINYLLLGKGLIVERRQETVCNPG